MGALVVDTLAEQLKERFKGGARNRADVVETRIAGHRVVLAKPRSYMNESGGAVSTLLKFFKVEPSQLIVIHDELDIPFDSIRLKVGGGNGGHNGIRDIDRALGTKDYARVRVGIGRPPGRVGGGDFVLPAFAPGESQE